MVGKSDFKENPKSDLDLDLGFVNLEKIGKLGKILEIWEKNVKSLKIG